jgi:outer membrane protein assembly factor BamB
MFHVKHSLTIQPNLRSMFHVKHRMRMTLAVIAVALLASGCTNLASPEGWAAPVADGDRLIVQLDRGTISAGRLSSNGAFTEEWRFPNSTDDLDFKGFYATPVVVDDVVYLVSYDGKVAALDVDSGRPTWPAVIELQENVVATPLIEGTSMFIPTEKGDVVVLDIANGAETDRLLDRDGRVWAAPIERAGTIYVGKLDARTLWAVKASDDSIEWQHDSGGAISADLAFAGDFVLAGALDSTMRAFDLTAEGDERWMYETRGWIVAAPLVAGDVVYGATLRGEVFALDTVSGAEKWLYTEDDLEFRARPILVDGVLIAADRDGRVRGLDPATGDLRWQADLDNTKFFADPLLFNGEILYLTKDGDLLSLSAADGSTVVVAGREG